MTSRKTSCRLCIALMAAGIMSLVLSPEPVQAADETSDEWTFELTPYVWTPDVSGETPAGTDIDLSFNRIYKNLEMVFMGAAVARRDKWSYMLDTVYMHIEDDDGGTTEGRINGVERTLDVDVKMKASITTAVAGYNLIDNDKGTLDAIGGARYNWLDVKLKLDQGVNAASRSLKRRVREDESEGNIDAVVGARGRFRFTDSWYLPYYTDVGAGDSNLTWQALGGVGYRFDWGDVAVTYRYLYFDFDSDYLLDDLTVKGPLFSATFYF